MTYRQFLRSPWVGRLLTGALVGRLPTAMVALALTLTLRAHGVDFGFVGLATAVLALAQGVGGPLLSRLVDRRGQTTVLLVASLLSALGMLVTALAPTSRPLVLAGTALAGAATPPLEPCLRALWPDLVGTGNLQLAYSVDAAAQEIIFVVGPILVAGTVLVRPPATALVLAALLCVAGTLVLALSGPSRRTRGAPATSGWLGPLRSVPLVLLLLGLAGVAVPVGGFTIVSVAYAEVHHVPGGAGVLLAVVASGALVGALVNGRVRWSGPPTVRAVPLSAGLAGSYLLVATMAPVPVLLLISFVAGGFLPPLLVIAFTLVDELAPAGTVVEAFAWLITLFTAGTAVGSALAGVVRDAAGVGAAAATTAGAGLLGTAVLLLFRRRYRTTFHGG